MKEKVSLQDKMSAKVQRKEDMDIKLTGKFNVVCKNKDGKVVWKSSFPNLVTQQGKNDILDKYFDGSSYTAAWYIGLISGNTFSSISVLNTANSHTGWREGANTHGPSYSQPTRPQITWAAASGGTKAFANSAVFSLTTGGTVKGAFVISQNSKDGFSGKLYSAALFIEGDQAVTPGDTLNITYTANT